MEAFLFLVVMIAVTWISFWCARDPNAPSKKWWPWDMLESEDRPAQPSPAPQKRQQQGWRGRAAPARNTPWRR